MKYPMFKVHVDVDLALKNVEEVLRSGFMNEGMQVTELTTYMSNYFDHKNVVALNSCTSALTLALKLAGVGPGDEVITTSMTCVASNTPIHNVGATLVWADIDRYTGNIDPNKVLEKITPKTKAVMCVNWAGLPCDLKRLQEICSVRGIKLIQDAAHGFGSTLDGKHVCHFADFTCYSLQAIKHITSGDGGLLVCNTDEDFNRAKKLKWFGIDREATKDENGEWKGQRWNVDIVEAGYKFHMNNVTAAIALSQIPHVERIITAHKNNAKLYTELLRSDKIRPMIVLDGTEPSHWVFTCLLDESLDRDSVILRLKQRGIDAGVVHTPNHHYTCFTDSRCSLEETEYFSSHQISLPCGWWLSAEDVRFISEKVLELVGERE
jgi:dTDP-4-amino-4,6-dideoxygalactose transaminase